MSEYKVNIENIFAGPLDLLLYLVRKDEVDIYDIPISNITKQYLDYVEILKSLDLDVAGDFLVMAATLMEIKSAMLLPRANPEDADDEGDAADPRHALIKQLLEYKKFKDAASLLDYKQSEQVERFVRPDSIIGQIKPNNEPELDLDQVSIWHLLETFDTLMRQTGRYQDYSQIKDDTPIDVYQVQVLEKLQFEGPMTFEHIFQGSNNKLVMIGLFLGLLELIRNKLIWAEQPESGVIYLKALTDDPAEEAVQNAILATEEENLVKVAQRMAGEQGASQDEDEVLESDLDDLDDDISDDFTDDDDEDIDEDEFLEELNSIKEGEVDLSVEDIEKLREEKQAQEEQELDDMVSSENDDDESNASEIPS